MRIEKNRFKRILLGIFVFFTILIVFIFSFEKEYNVNKHLETQSKLFNSVYQSTYKGYHAVADTVYDTILNKPKVIEILSQAQNHSRQDTLRKQLYLSLYHDYKLLEKQYIGQLQFHLPNCISFLRMNRPDLYGDDLTPIRPTIVNIAKTHQFIDSFEQGKLFNGFRFVYPLFKNNNYVGSVEISFSSLSILSKMMKDYDVLTNILHKKDSTNISLMNKPLDYMATPIENYFFEKRVIKLLGNNFNPPKNIKKMREKVSKKMIEEKLFSIYKSSHDRVITFIPIKHKLNGKLLAYILLNSHSDYISHKIMFSQILMLLTILLLALILFFIYRETMSKNRLKISEKKSRTILNASASMLIVWDKEKVVEANETFFRFFDRYSSLDEFNQKYTNFCGVFHPLEEENFISCDLDKNKKWFNLIVDNNERTFKTAIEKNGKLYYFILHIKSTVISEQSMYLIELTDISNEMSLRMELKKKDVQLFHKHKMAQMGEMINTIAHQWRQPLAIINTLVAISKEKLLQNQLKGEDLKQKLSAIEENTAYMSNTIEDFLQFHKPMKYKELFSVNEMMKSTLKIIKPTLDSASIDVQFHEYSHIEIEGYEREFSQVVLALLSNARDELISRKIDTPWVSVTLEELEGYLYVYIEDNAKGISEEMILKVFEPYFSTKEQKQGSGLGLYISKMIIETSMEGIIDVKNTKNGAQFCIRIKK